MDFTIQTKREIIDGIEKSVKHSPELWTSENRKDILPRYLDPNSGAPEPRLILRAWLCFLAVGVVVKVIVGLILKFHFAIDSSWPIFLFLTIGFNLYWSSLCVLEQIYGDKYLSTRMDNLDRPCQCEFHTRSCNVYVWAANKCLSCIGGVLSCIINIMIFALSVAAVQVAFVLTGISYVVNIVFAIGFMVGDFQLLRFLLGIFAIGDVIAIGCYYGPFLHCVLYFWPDILKQNASDASMEEADASMEDSPPAMGKGSAHLDVVVGTVVGVRDRLVSEIFVATVIDCSKSADTKMGTNPYMKFEDTEDDLSDAGSVFDSVSRRQVEGDKLDLKKTWDSFKEHVDTSPDLSFHESVDENSFIATINQTKRPEEIEEFASGVENLESHEHGKRHKHKTRVSFGTEVENVESHEHGKSHTHKSRASLGTEVESVESPEHGKRHTHKSRASLGTEVENMEGHEHGKRHTHKSREKAEVENLESHEHGKRRTHKSKVKAEVENVESHEHGKRIGTDWGKKARKTAKKNHSSSSPLLDETSHEKTSHDGSAHSMAIVDQRQQPQGIGHFASDLENLKGGDAGKRVKHRSRMSIEAHEEKSERHTTKTRASSSALFESGTLETSKKPKRKTLAF